MTVATLALPRHIPLIGTGEVRHTRYRPSRHAFAYATWFLLLPMRSMALHGSGDLPVNRRALLSFHDIDHGDGRTAAQGGALAWLEELLFAQGIHDAQGEVWLHTYARVLGYVFKPVSFWYCHREDGSLAAMVAEVNNTFGERHCYVLPSPRYGVSMAADKVFYVSPFCQVQGNYSFRFMRSQRADADRTVVRNDQRQWRVASLERRQLASRLVVASPAQLGCHRAYPLASAATVAQTRPVG